VLGSPTNLKAEVAAEHVEELVFAAVNMKGRRMPDWCLVLEQTDGIAALGV